MITTEAWFSGAIAETIVKDRLSIFGTRIETMLKAEYVEKLADSIKINFKPGQPGYIGQPVLALVNESKSRCGTYWGTNGQKDGRGNDKLNDLLYIPSNSEKEDDYDIELELNSPNAMCTIVFDIPHYANSVNGKKKSEDYAEIEYDINNELKLRDSKLVLVSPNNKIITQ